MASVGSETAEQYDSAASGWSDKMRLLGYFDAYLGFLSSHKGRAAPGRRVLDVGCGTGAMAEAWVAIQGPNHAVSLLDPSRNMLARARAALARRDVDATPLQGMLGETGTDRTFEVVLAAHVLEHASDPVEMLRKMRASVAPGATLWLVVSKPHWCNAIIWLQWRHKSYRPPEVARMLAASGWALQDEYAFPSGPPSRTSRGYVAQAN